MTFTLPISSRRNAPTPSAAIRPLLRRSLAGATSVLRLSARIPAAIQQAFTMAYADPYCLPPRKDDWSNPDNY
jgi:hypothetical protein